MKIIEKLAANNSDPIENPAPVIAFLGDSVTQGCFLSQNDYEAAYHNRVRQKLNYLFPRAVVNIINAGIGGTTAKLGAKRIERDVLSKNPDLCVVCFGLNDVGGVDAGLPIYKKSLETIFEKLQKSGCEVIFMTPNMLNTQEIDEIIPKQHREYATYTCKLQNEGMMDRYMAAAAETAKKYNIPVCDCYAKWKKMEENGVDTTRLLVNGINHPRHEMHDLFANSLVEIMFE